MDLYRVSSRLAISCANLCGVSRTEFQLPASTSSGPDLDHAAAMAQPAQNVQANAEGGESLLNTIWSIGQKAFLAWAISQLGMQ